ncbi:prostaglandin F2-alpha receptor [Aplochiton taeniatus]
MSTNRSTESVCRSAASDTNTTCTQEELAVTASIVSMTVGLLSNILALGILMKAYHRFRFKSKALFLLFASGLVVTDFLGHLVNGSLVLYVYSSYKNWEVFDPQNILCGLFGASMVFFGLSPLFLGSAMAVERCIGITKPLFHSTAMAAHHMKRLLGLTWLVAAMVALLPVLLRRPYQVQRSQSWCFFRIEGPRDWLDILLPLLFSMLGLLALIVSIACNMYTSCTLLHSRLHRKHHHKGPSHHLEMICQLLTIMLVSCVCWGPLLILVIIRSTEASEGYADFSLLLVVRFATWNQILDPWVYILLRKAVLKKLFLMLPDCWGRRSHTMHRWKCSILRGSVETSSSAMISAPVCSYLNGRALPDIVINPIS